MSSIFTCPDLIAFHLSHVLTSGILHDYLLNGYRIPSQGENVSINQWHINSRCIFLRRLHLTCQGYYTQLFGYPES